MRYKDGIKLNRVDVKEFIKGAGLFLKSGRYGKNRGGHRPMTVYECRKCAERFDAPDKVKVNEKIKERIISVCPLCKSSAIVEIKCGTCDHYKNRQMPCGLGYRTIVPFSVACWNWTIRNLNKPKVM